LLKFTVSDSDNNACDILFRLIGGTKKVHQHLQKLGIKDLQIVATEEEMGQSWAVQYSNWTTPKAMVQLLQKFYQGNILSKTSHDFLWKIMAESSTGLNRLKKSLPKGTIIAHKTGTSGSKDGIMGAVNDAGVVVLPNGKRLIIVVLVANSKANIAANEAVIAKIAKVASESF
jgi:beta-lactamase class A